MASAEIGALRVMLSLNAGEYSRGMQRAGKDTQDFGSTIERISDKINAASIHFNTGMMAAQRFANVIHSIVGVTREFGSGMSAVATLVDTNVESMKNMQEAVLAIGRRTPVALTDLTTGLYDLRSAGSTAENAMERLERSAQLGVAGLGTTKEAVDLVTSSINAFGLKGREADDVYNNIFKTIQAGKTTISGLAQGFGAVASTVSTAGISLKEYLAAIAALTVTGVPAAVAHTQIRAAIAGVTRESELGTKVLNAMGSKTFKDLQEKSGGMVAAFQNIVKAVGGNDAALIKLFGSVEAYNAVISLSGKQNEMFTANMAKMNDGLDAVGEGFEKRNAGMGAAIDKMSNAFAELGIALGEALTPAIKAVSEAVIGITSAFKSLDPEVQSALATFGLLAAVVAPAIAAIGFFGNALASLIPVIAAVGAVVTGFIAASGPIGLFVISASAAVTAWNIFKEEIIAIWNSVASFISDKVDFIIGKITYMGQVIGDMWSSITGGDFQGAADKFAAAITDPFKQLETQMGLVSQMWDVTDEKAKKAAENAYKYAGPVIGANEAMKESHKGLTQAMREGTKVFEETMTPLEKIIFKQLELNSLLNSGAIDADTFGRAMASNSVYSQKNMDALATNISSNLSTIFGDSKAVAIATALINTAQGITKALASYPPPVSFAMAAIQAAAGFAQVANIRKQTAKGSGSGSGGGGDGGASNAAAATATAGGVNQTLMVQGISPGQMFSGDTMRQFAESILQYQRDGGKVILERA